MTTCTYYVTRDVSTRYYVSIKILIRPLYDAVDFPVIYPDSLVLNSYINGTIRFDKFGVFCIE